MKYTLITYKPNYTDMCRNCVMDRTDSNAELYINLSEEALEEKLVKILKLSIQKNISSRDSQTGICILYNVGNITGTWEQNMSWDNWHDGIGMEDSDWDEHDRIVKNISKIYDSAYLFAQEAVRREEQKRRDVLDKQAMHKLLEEEKQERAQYLKLKEKYELIK